MRPSFLDDETIPQTLEVRETSEVFPAFIPRSDHSEGKARLKEFSAKVFGLPLT
jgi:hypothetical protein